MNSSTLNVPWGLRDVIIAIVLAVVMVLVSLVLVVGGTTLVLALRSDLAQNRGGIVLAGVAATIVYEVGFFVVAYAVARWRGGTLADLGFRGFAPIGFALATGALFAALTLEILNGLLFYWLGWTDNPQRLDLLVGDSPVSLILALIAGSIAAPIAEETFFRGFVLPGLYARTGMIGAIVISSGLFAFSHLVPQVFPLIFCLGVLLALLRIFTGALWPSIAVHMVFNTISLVAAFFLPKTLGS